MEAKVMLAFALAFSPQTSTNDKNYDPFNPGQSLSTDVPIRNRIGTVQRHSSRSLPHHREAAGISTHGNPHSGANEPAAPCPSGDCRVGSVFNQFPLPYSIASPASPSAMVGNPVVRVEGFQYPVQGYSPTYSVGIPMGSYVVGGYPATGYAMGGGLSQSRPGGFFGGAGFRGGGACVGRS